MSVGFNCAEPLQGNDGNYHLACLKLLFGPEQLPTIDVDLAASRCQHAHSSNSLTTFVVGKQRPKTGTARWHH